MVGLIVILGGRQVFALLGSVHLVNHEHVVADCPRVVVAHIFVLLVLVA